MPINYRQSQSCFLPRPERAFSAKTRRGVRFFFGWALAVFFMGPSSYGAASEACRSSLGSTGDSMSVEHKLKTVEEEALAVAPKFFDYFQEASQQIREREYVMTPMQLAWLAKEHILLVGPPGNAKTTISKILMGNVKEAKTNRPSFFATQMTAETSLADTHGGINYKVLNETGRQERLYDEGVLGSHFAFFDEQFDMRPNGYRNVLDILAERAHAQGNRFHVGKTWTVVGASNTFIPEIYAKFDGSEQPRALIDRYSFVIYVPADMELVESNRAIIQGSQKYRSDLPELTFEDIKHLQALVPKVEIPDHVADLLSLIQYRLRPLFETTEQVSIHDFNEKIQNGEKPLPPYRSTKYMSPRTLGKAAGILKAAVVLDFLKTKGQRPLVASIKDLTTLEQFYALNGPSPSFIQTQMSRASKEVEKEQLKNLMMERNLVQETFKKTIDEYQQALTSYSVQDIHSQVLSYNELAAPQRRMLMDALAVMYRDSLAAQNGLQYEHSPEKIAQASMTELIHSWVKMMVPEKHEIILETWVKDLPFSQEKLRGRYGSKRSENGPKKGGFAQMSIRTEKLKKATESLKKGAIIEVPVEVTKQLVNIANSDPRLFKHHLMNGLYLRNAIDFTYVYIDEKGQTKTVPKADFDLGVDAIALGPFLKYQANSSLLLVNGVNEGPSNQREPLVDVSLSPKVGPRVVMLARNHSLLAFGNAQSEENFSLKYDPVTNTKLGHWEKLSKDLIYRNVGAGFFDSKNAFFPYDYFNVGHLSVFRQMKEPSVKGTPAGHLVIVDHKKRTIFRETKMAAFANQKNILWYIENNKLNTLQFSLTQPSEDPQDQKNQELGLLFKDHFNQDREWVSLAGLKKWEIAGPQFGVDFVNVWVERGELHVVALIKAAPEIGTVTMAKQLYQAVYTWGDPTQGPILKDDNLQDLPVPIRVKGAHLEVTDSKTIYIYGPDYLKDMRVFLSPPLKASVRQKD